MEAHDDDRPERAFCLFTSGSRPLGVALSAVAEVVEPGRLVRLPLCPSQVLGLCTYRGRFVPVVGPGTQGVERFNDRDGDGTAVLVLRTEHGFWGLSIDRIGVAVEDACEPRDGPAPPIPGGFVALGVVEHDGVGHAILDPGRTWRGLRSEIDRWYRDARGLDAPATPRPA